MGLSEYRRKRDFSRTGEPAGKAKPRRGGNSYLIQKHAATRLHYDLRLEHDGVLKSWAVPKGPSLNPSEKRLAVEVEDHPLEYGTFEGTIPKGEYGGGTVILWDRGTWTPKADPELGFSKGHLKFGLQGKKLRGGWALVRMRGRDGSDKNWLLIKERDKFAREGGEIVEELPNSVKSGKSLEEIGGSTKKVWHSGAKQPRPAFAQRVAAARAQGSRAGKSKAGARAARKKAKPARRKTARSGRIDPASLPGARRGVLPTIPELELATLVDGAPEGVDWLHEIKFDGYRIAARIQGGDVRLISRNGKDWTARFAHVAEAFAELGVDEAIFDGELVALDPGGAGSFQSLQRALSEERGDELAWFGFDVLHLDGFDLTAVALLERKRLLETILAHAAGTRERLRYSEHIVGNGRAVYGRACERGLEGIVSKRADSLYRPGRGRDWLKVKCQREQELAIGGFTDPEGAREGFGALLLGVYERGKLKYAGRVGTGFDEATLRDLRRRMRPLERATPAFVDPPRGAQARGVHWLEPVLVAQVAFTEWTEDGSLRHPSFLGLREDKRAEEVAREVPVARAGKRSSVTARTARAQPEKRARETKRAVPRAPPGRIRRGGEEEAAGIRLTHPERVLYPDAGITKLELARYYAQVAERMLPHVERRVLTLVRCPQGTGKPCFFQKHQGEGVPPAIRSIEVREDEGTGTYLYLEDAAGLVSLVQMSALEIHTWGSRIDRLEKPDLLVFDLDPDEGLAFGRVVEAAREVRKRLSDLGLESFVKTTGGKGLHVVLPLERRLEWEETKAFCRDFASSMAREEPLRYTAVLSKASRKGRLFIDYLRNGRGATAIAPYSARARPGATVATPLAWDELDARLKPQAFTIRTVPKRLEKLRKDPWAGFFKLKQSLTADLRRAVSGTG
jgi:bifunctional non-homologous end joining protein LigD